VSGPPPEPELNELLRQVDWRFLLGQRQAPRLLDRRGEPFSRALTLIGEGPSDGGEADLVVLGFPDRASLKATSESLRPGGAVACLWQRPLPRGTQRARAMLKRAGFVDTRLYWPGPHASPLPRFWLPLDSPAAIAHVHEQHPVYSRREAALRLAWRWAVLAGALAPVCAIARLPEGPAAVDDEPDALAEALPRSQHWLLLTGGGESDNKVVGLPFPEHGGPLPIVAKFGRVEKAGAALEREAEILADLERERPDLAGVPRLRSSGLSAGGRAVLQDAMLGAPLQAELYRTGFTSLAPALTEWLASLAGEPPPQAASEWFGRLVTDPLDELEADFGKLMPPGFADRARAALADLGPLPLVCEHRDLGPWNVVIGEDGGPAAIDWEDAEPRGLPCLDLVYLLATSALLLDGALNDTSNTGPIAECYERLLDPATEAGGIAARCFATYRDRLGVSEADFPRLRLLCWIVQALIAFRRQAKPAYFTDLAEVELRRLEVAAP
jgi:Phosphotransferase enzyme family